MRSGGYPSNTEGSRSHEKEIHKSSTKRRWLAAAACAIGVESWSIIPRQLTVNSTMTSQAIRRSIYWMLLLVVTAGVTVSSIPQFHPIAASSFFVIGLRIAAIFLLLWSIFVVRSEPALARTTLAVFALLFLWDLTRYL